MKKDFYFLSKDNKTQIHCIEWIPEVKPVAILQICHGMCEFIDRYDEFANYLADKGYYVVGNDHLGHGESVVDEDHYGYFHENNGNKYLLADIHQVRKITEEKYPELPYFVLGHSMGSFLIRQYITMEGFGLTGAILMGTGIQPAALVSVGKNLCRALAKGKGWFERNEILNKISFGSYNKRIDNPRTEKDWLSRDEETVNKYVANPWCTYTFTLNGFYNMFVSIEESQNKAHIESIPKDLPLLIVSGGEDPVGNYGVGAVKAYALYQNAGIEDIHIKIYEDYRQEILNEIGREQVFHDLKKWMDNHI